MLFLFYVSVGTVMTQEFNQEALRQKVWSFNTALFFQVAFGASALLAFWLGDYEKGFMLGGGIPIITGLAKFSDDYNKRVPTIEDQGHHPALSNSDENFTNDIE